MSKGVPYSNVGNPTDPYQLQHALGELRSVLEAVGDGTLKIGV